MSTLATNHSTRSRHRTGWLELAIVLLAVALVLAGCSGTGEETASDADEPTVEPTGAQGTDAETSDDDANETEPESLTEVKLVLNWTGMTEAHTPIALAIENGYFEDQGLSVSVDYLLNSANVVNFVADAGDDPVFGWTDSSLAALSINQGRDIKVIGTIFRKTPLGVVSAEERGVSSFTDLAGKSIAAGTGGMPSLIFPAAFEAAGGDANAVEVVTMDAAAMLTSYQAGQVDGIISFNYLMIPPVAAEETVSAFSFADHGFNILNLGFIAHNDYLEANPDVARGFMAALVAGWEAAVQDPAASIAAGEAFGDDITPDNREVQQAILEGSLDLLYGPDSEGVPLGCTTVAEWQETQDVLVEYGDMADPQDVETYFTNEYLPDCP